MWGPRIEGRIVDLRPIAASEIRIVVEWFADPDVVRHLGGPFSARAPAAVRDWWESSGVSSDVVVWGLEAEGRLVGYTRIFRIDWVSRNAMTGTAIGDRTAWGRGIATEVMRLRSAFAFRQLQLHKLVSGYIKDNVASGRAQARCGYRVVGTARDEEYRDDGWHDFVMTELMRADWEAAH